MTPVEELFQLLWDTPQDKLTWFAIKKRMLEKERKFVIKFGWEVAQNANWDYEGLGEAPFVRKDIANHYDKNFITREK